jgi:hypothetical protein
MIKHCRQVGEKQTLLFLEKGKERVLRKAKLLNKKGGE